MLNRTISRLNTLYHGGHYEQVFCLSRDEKLDANTMADIMAAGYSRVLVYEGADTRNIRGYLQVRYRRDLCMDVRMASSYLHIYQSGGCGVSSCIGSSASDCCFLLRQRGIRRR